MLSTRRKGMHYEDLAHDFLLRQGLKAVHRNFQNRMGEIDLIMLHRHTLCFIEVKYRKNDRFGGVAFSVPLAKQRKITRTALDFVARNKCYHQHDLRFDVVLITPQKQAQEDQLEWIENAFYPQDAEF